MRIECQNITDKDCDYTFNADTSTDAIREMRTHMQITHPETTENEISDMEVRINSEFENG